MVMTYVYENEIVAGEPFNKHFDMLGKHVTNTQVIRQIESCNAENKVIGVSSDSKLCFARILPYVTGIDCTGMPKTRSSSGNRKHSLLQVRKKVHPIQN